MAEDVKVPEWGPLEQLARVLAASPMDPVIDPDDFMYVWRVEARGRPAIHLYKHIDTRRYLNLDDAGHAYVYAGPPKRERAGGRRACIYRLLRDVQQAIDNLELHLIHPRSVWVERAKSELAAELPLERGGGEDARG